MQPTFLISLKICWSIIWRWFVYLFGLGIIAFCLYAFNSFLSNANQTGGSNPALIILIFISLLGWIVALIFINCWIINELPDLQYNECRVILIKHDKYCSEYGVFDAFCLYYSMLWRIWILVG